MILKRKLFARMSGLPRTTRNITYKILGGTPKAARKAVKVGKGVHQTQAYLYTTAPGEMLADSVGLVAKHPIQTSLSVIPIPASSVWLAPPAEKAARKFIPGYSRATDAVKSKYDKGKVRRVVSSFGNALATLPA